MRLTLVGTGGSVRRAGTLAPARKDRTGWSIVCLPGMRVIALSTYDEPEKGAKMFRAGAEGYVLKTASSEELLAALRGQESHS